MVFLLCIFLVTSGVKNKEEILKYKNFGEIEKLEWVDPYGRKAQGFKSWAKFKKDLQNLRVGNVFSRYIKTRENLVDIIVDSRIYYGITSELNQFSTDLQSEGYSVQIDTISGMNAESLRAHLTTLQDLVGAIFIGEIPIAWYEMNYWGEEEFPIDLYFMDLDGNWIDSDGDGLFDAHTGDVEPEIWVGRLYARPLLWDDEISLMKSYFAKNHQYRTIGLGIQQRGLSFVDDDWYYFGSCGLDSVYSDIVVINNENLTIAERYRTELNEGYEWIQLCAHSSPWGHTFKVPSGYAGTVFNYEVFVLNPNAIFYNLFACSGTRFVEENYSAGWYIFGDTYGLSIVGSTKTGSMLDFENFYDRLGDGANIGEAFKKWFIMYGESSRAWFYGLNIIGDPTIKPLMGTKLASNNKLKNSSPNIHLGNGWSTPEVVAYHSESDGTPNLANIDGNLWMIFQSGRSTTNGRSDIYSIYKEDGLWSDLMNIGPHVYWDFNPVIGLHKGEPIAVWVNFGDGYNLKYSKYEYGSWIQSRNISSDPSWDLKPSIASIGDNLFLAWQTRRDLESDIYVSYLHDTLWSTPERVTQSGYDEYSPVVIVDRDNLPWIFYCRYVQDGSQIWYSYWDGASWVEDGPLSKRQLSAYSPAATVDSIGRIWVSWQGFDEGKGNIYVSYYDGITWSLPEKITFYCDNNIFPGMTTNQDGKCWIAWQGKYNGDWNIYTVYLGDTLWSEPEVIELEGPGINPTMTVDSSNVWVAWQNYQLNEWNIYISGRSISGINEDYTKTPQIFGISGCNPNPFTEFTSIRYELPISCNVSLRIYDLSGRMVKVLLEGEVKAGCYSIRWDGRDILGNKVKSGIYFCRFEAKRFKSTKKLIYLD